MGKCFVVLICFLEGKFSGDFVWSWGGDSVIVIFGVSGERVLYFYGVGVGKGGVGVLWGLFIWVVY